MVNIFALELLRKVLVLIIVEMNLHAKQKIFNLCKIIILNKFKNKNLLDKEILRIYKKLIIG
jgi:hypothetical protein